MSAFLAIITFIRIVLKNIYSFPSEIGKGCLFSNAIAEYNKLEKAHVKL